jgi:hypothetical protein
MKGRQPERRNHDTILLLLPLQGFGVLYLLRRALPYANAGCPFRGDFVNIYFVIKTEFSSVRSVLCRAGLHLSVSTVKRIILLAFLFLSFLVIAPIVLCFRQSLCSCFYCSNDKNICVFVPLGTTCW